MDDVKHIWQFKKWEVVVPIINNSTAKKMVNTYMQSIHQESKNYIIKGKKSKLLHK